MIRNIKVHYRARQLSRTILCLDSGKTYEVNILATIHMLAEASKAVKANSIVHCFRHAGFAAAEEPGADDLDVGDPDGTDNVEDLMRNLHSGGVNVTATMTFKDFARADNDIVSSEKPTDEEILRQIAPQSESGSVDDDDDRPAVGGGDRHRSDAFVERLQWGCSLGWNMSKPNRFQAWYEARQHYGLL